jgi:hypothetical protein
MGGSWPVNRFGQRTDTDRARAMFATTERTRIERVFTMAVD